MIRFRGRWRLVYEVVVREKTISIFMVKVGKSWTDPCISCSYQIGLAEWGAIRIAMRNVPVPICPVDHPCTAANVFVCPCGQTFQGVASFSRHFAKAKTGSRCRRFIDTKRH